MKQCPRRALVVAGALLSIVSQACDDPLVPPQLIARTRVVAARVEVDGDPSRATPEPSERVNVRVLTLDPLVDTTFTWQLSACTSPGAAYGLPDCSGGPFASTRTGAPGEVAPQWQLVVPAEASIGDSAMLLVTGVVCSRGEPSEDASGCEGEAADGDRVSIPIGLESRAPNRNPSLADDRIELDGVPWDEPGTLSTDACEGLTTLPLVAGGSGDHKVVVVVQGGDRETVDDGALTTGGEGGRETLQVDYYVTAGELDVASSFVEADDVRDVVPLHVTWTAPSTPPPRPQLVRMVVVSRDLRGGADWAIRGLCLTP